MSEGIDDWLVIYQVAAVIVYQWMKGARIIRRKRLVDEIIWWSGKLFFPRAVNRKFFGIRWKKQNFYSLPLRLRFSIPNNTFIKFRLCLFEKEEKPKKKNLTYYYWWYYMTAYSTLYLRWFTRSWGAKNIVYKHIFVAPQSRLAQGYSWEYYPTIRAKGQYL